jgi:hypothetical protein
MGQPGSKTLRCKLGLQCIWSSLTVVLFGLALSSHAPAWGVPIQKVDVSELRKALRFYQSIERLEVDFKQTKILKDIALELKSEGRMTLSLPHRVQWKILKPQPLTVELEQQKVTIQSATATQTFSQSENPSAKDRKNFETMLSWLKLDPDAIAANYFISKIAENQYRFVSQETSDPVFKALEMELLPAGHVSKLRFQESSGDEIRIQFSKPVVVYRKNK